MIEMIPTHEIRNDNLRPDTCPASLMSFPLDQEMMNLLHAMERTHYIELLEKARRENSEPPRMPFLEPPPSGSQSMLPKPGNRRFGRTPATEEDEPDWQLGGRQGFEVSGTPKPGQPIPPSTGGYPMTGRSAHMSVASVRALIATATTEANGAYGALTEAIDPRLYLVINQLTEVLLEQTSNAYAGLENAKRTIDEANEEFSDSLAAASSIYANVMNELQATRAALQEAKEKVQAAVSALEDDKNDIQSAVNVAEEYGASLRT